MKAIYSLDPRIATPLLNSFPHVALSPRTRVPAGMAWPFSSFDEPTPVHRLWRSRPAYAPDFRRPVQQLMSVTAVSQLTSYISPPNIFEPTQVSKSARRREQLQKSTRPWSVQRKLRRDDLVRTHCAEIVASMPHIECEAKVLRIRTESRWGRCHKPVACRQKIFKKL
jgi:hypothetical protein